MKKIFLMVLSAAFLWSCNSGTQNESAQHDADTVAGHEHHYNESDAPLELNDGERWVVNEEMKPYVAKSEELLATYQQNDNADHQALGTQLQEQNTLLIQSCTMTGKSHDELHKWLHPHMALIAELSSTTDEVEAERLTRQIKASMDTYHAYFQ